MNRYHYNTQSNAKVVLNAVIARQNGGGATQIVINYINASLNDDSVEWYYIVSVELADMLGDVVDYNSAKWLILPRQPQIKSYLKTKHLIDSFIRKVKPDVVYSILAPSYFHFKQKEVMRCCNPWDVIDRDDEAFSFLDYKTKLKFCIKTWFVRRLMRRSDYFITQTETAKMGIVRVTGIDKDKVSVIPNVLPRYFQSVKPCHKTSNVINIVYVASQAPNKNFEIIPKVAYYLKHVYGLRNFRFLITLSTDNQYYYRILKDSKALFVESEIVCIGEKTQQELVDLYNSATIGFFPSVLETFSATLLEYMYFDLPIVASDKPFNIEILDDAAVYFKSTDADGAANAILSILNSDDLRNSIVEKSKNRLSKYSDYNQHYKDTISLFSQISR